MDRFTEKQQEIDQRATEIIAEYPALWSKMITECRQPGSEDRAWLMYSANYLFRTAGVRWAMDPLRLSHKLPDAPEMPVDDLQDLDFILLTHQHSDHLDLGLLRSLQIYSILWVVPAPLLPIVRADIDIAADRLIVPEAMRTIDVRGIRITPFDGLHWEFEPESQSPRGVPAMGYLVEFNGKRWLFPGDTRTYDASQLPGFGPVDGVFAHVWLGRGCALMDEPPQLNEFCQFFMSMRSQQIVLTHLYEFGRDAQDFWDNRHVQDVSSCIFKRDSKISISSASIGDGVKLI